MAWNNHEKKVTGFSGNQKVPSIELIDSLKEPRELVKNGVFKTDRGDSLRLDFQKDRLSDPRIAGYDIYAIQIGSATLAEVMVHPLNTTITLADYKQGFLESARDKCIKYWT